ncbi:hypothetical protein EUTSA_v10002963mg [Eutrema salsugineum]|uniref:MULE transposase domain-containing protein n=1 Tax=Eutrema salsugineum TaxID=72664 RepID=V4MYG3_EUTSA|nr:hypothetical protein EUTSA_v10002963mg [Eutrema salsugineum]
MINLTPNSFLYLLKETNPDTVAILDTESVYLGRPRFRSLFLAYGSSRRAFSKVKPVIVLGGNYLKGRNKSFLFMASTNDSNNQQFPLAIAIVERETSQTWQWFIFNLRTIYPDTTDLTIVSSMSQLIYQSLDTLYGIPGLLGLLQQASKAYTVPEFRHCFKAIRSKNSHCAEFLKALGFQRWSMAYSKGDRFNIHSSEVYDLRPMLKQDTIMNLLNFYHWHKTLIPCEHCLSAAKHLGISPLLMVGNIYSTDQWLQTYCETVSALPYIAHNNFPMEVNASKLMPPRNRPIVGRRKRCYLARRIEGNSQDHIPEGFYPYSLGGPPSICSRCRDEGHTAVTCFTHLRCCRCPAL